MEPREYKNIYQNEETHFYYRTVHDLVENAMIRHSPVTQPSVLDAGCGTGGLAKRLLKHATVKGVDWSPEACRLAGQRGVEVQQGDLNSLPFTNGQFDCIASVDVLCQKQVDDNKAMGELFRVLKPGGILLLRVPALPWLTSPHDRFVHTRERYDKAKLKRKIQDAGFQVRRISYTGLLLLPFAIATHCLDKLGAGTTSHSRIRRLPKMVNQIFYSLLRWEQILFSRLDLPCGLGLFVIAEKRP